MIELISTPKLGSYKTPPMNQPQPVLIWKPKGYLGSFGLSVLFLLMTFLLMVSLSRIVALPGLPLSEWPVFHTLGQFGAMINHSLTLTWVPYSDRDTVIYLLLLPTAALMISITRLTFGLRILGYRSVLIAVGFNEIGIFPSLTVIIVVVGIILVLRPTMDHVRLPLYGRVSIVLGITSCILITSLFMGSWFMSEWVWSLAFFPVIILAMMAESVARTLDIETAQSAAWRLIWTIIIALILVGFMNNPIFVDVLLRFPELMLLQVLAIILVSEYLDLRLFQDWHNTIIGTTISKFLLKTTHNTVRKPRVAIIRNRSFHGTIGRLGPIASDKTRTESIKHLITALEDAGYFVKVFEGDRTLLSGLRKFLLPHPRTGIPGGMALNLSTGIQGYGRHTHVPGMLEMAGIAYTGSDPVGHARLQDRLNLFSLLQQAGVLVPRFYVIRDSNSSFFDLNFPAFVLPRSDPDAAILVKNAADVSKAIKQIQTSYDQDILLQSHIVGPEFRVTIVGNQYLECLPLLHNNTISQQRECPALIEDQLANRIRDCAFRAYRAAGCRDYARVDIRLNADEQPCVVGIQVQNIFARKGSVAIMIEAAGLNWSKFLRHIIELAATRTGSELSTKLSSDTYDNLSSVNPLVIDYRNSDSHTIRSR